MGSLLDRTVQVLRAIVLALAAFLLFVVVLSLVLVANANAQELERVQVIEAPPEYEDWWDHVVEQCECDPAVSFDEITWYSVSGNDGFECLQVPDAWCDGQWVRMGDVNYIVLTTESLRRWSRVSHEMLHAILNEPDHSPRFNLIERRLGNSW